MTKVELLKNNQGEQKDYLSTNNPLYPPFLRGNFCIQKGYKA